MTKFKKKNLLLRYFPKLPFVLKKMGRVKESVLFLVLLCCISLNESRNIGKFWHVADLHVDNRYSENGNPEFMCWEVSGKTLDANFNRPGKYGDFQCDAPQILIDSALDAMKDILPNPDFILWTGDDTTHVNDSFFSTQIVVDIVANLTNDIKRRFPDTIVFPVLGNHDLYPKNQIRVGRSQLLTKVADIWKKWLDEYNAYSDFLESGSYTASIKNSNIAVMGLNTVVWYKSNKITANDLTDQDPGGLFAWADHQLQSLQSQGKKVLVIGHIAPGISMYKGEVSQVYQPRYNKQYIKLATKYGLSTIAGQFFGHLHRDTYRVFLTKDGEMITPISFALLAPSVTPWSQSNPGLRLITYDKDTAEILESTTYYLDLTKANAIKKAVWVHEYNLTKMLGLNTINGSTLYDATIRMKDSSRLFDLYYPVYSVQLEDASHCSKSCRKSQLCAKTNIDYSKFDTCVGSSATIYAPSAFVLGLISSLFVFNNN